jgi:ketosteroid isomerase-like protein
MHPMKSFFLCSAAAFLLCCAASAQDATAPVPAQAPATAAASTSEQPGATSAVSPEVAQFQKIEDSWADAVNRRDQYGLELVLSPLFVDISAGGDVTNRNQQVVQVITGEDKTVYLMQKVITVRMLGDIAVVNGTYSWHHKGSSGPVDEKGVFTHVFERVRNGWLCINSQRTVLRQEPSTKQKKASSSSPAQMPFHIPLFTKSDKGPQ